VKETEPPVHEVLTDFPALLAQAADASASGVPGGVLASLLAFGGLALVLQAVTVVFQIVCVVHVIRRREDYWWIFLILFFPLVGSLVYTFVVIWPEWQQRARFHRGGTGAGGPAKARRRLPALERQLALSDTVEHRAELAAAYCDAGEFVLARQCYEGCLQGPYANDPHLLVGLAKACFGEGQFERCLECARRIDRREIPERVKELELIEAQALLALGRDAEGIAILRALAPRAAGLDPRWRLAEALAKRGEDREADDTCRRLLEDSARLGAASRKREKEWIALAQQRLKARA
jgi:hypothetical protein